MDGLEHELRMSDGEADMETLEDMRQNLGAFATFFDMMEAGE